ncbi:E3 ubiquitin-protein ligase MARCHF11-like isoform X3 [Macadamia integrifolia]|uniref:E3 ubiquitin-protein ligase MARCHF11-like isoform X3 n=1 Tax=Macadamia integrifolia TaxID=60698 RepID=UPI001C4FE032|nr:E3 ubiquitin-protein ligase MARCHF11-like isoform X3 [Macadamia integrifolia]
MQGADVPGSSGAPGSDCDDERKHEVSDEEKPLIQVVECRICQEEDHIKNLEIPCACSGSLKRQWRWQWQWCLEEEEEFAHRKCVQLWCNEKGDITCEICHQTYHPGYIVHPLPPQSEDTPIDPTEAMHIDEDLDRPLTSREFHEFANEIRNDVRAMRIAQMDMVESFQHLTRSFQEMFNHIYSFVPPPPPSP